MSKDTVQMNVRVFTENTVIDWGLHFSNKLPIKLTVCNTRKVSTGCQKCECKHNLSTLVIMPVSRHDEYNFKILSW